MLPESDNNADSPAWPADPEQSPVQANPFYATSMSQGAVVSQPAPIAAPPRGLDIPPPAPGMADYNTYAGTFVSDELRGTSTWAVLSLVFSVVGILVCALLTIAGVVCGIIALGETGPAKKKGRGMAIAGIIIGSLSVAASVAVLAYMLSKMR